MSTVSHGGLWLTELDHGRLFKLASGHPPACLVDLLDSAEIVPSTELRPDAVSLYSQVLVREDDTGAQRKLTLCYPHEAEPHAGFISVLSPVGLALLGRCVGARVTWRPPSGAQRSLTIEAVLFQPEATGDYTT